MKITFSRILTLLLSLIFLGSITIVPLGSQESQSISITQVDARDLLLSGQAHLFLDISHSPQAMATPSKGDFKVFERLANGQEQEIGIVNFEIGIGREQGMGIFLLVDNSGSMYEVNSAGLSRIEQVRQALAAFLQDFRPELDQVGLGIFNTLYRLEAPMDSSAAQISSRIQAISKPERDMAYTELYGSLNSCLDTIRLQEGRKAVIVLSDGQDFPWQERTGKPHPEWGEQRFDPQSVGKAFRKEGVTLYAVNFAPEQDPNLAAVCQATGGRVFEARNTEELLGVYQAIQESIRNEVRISCELPVSNAQERTLRVEYQKQTAEAWLLAPLLLGPASDFLWYVLLIILVLGAGTVLVLFFFPFEKAIKKAELTVLDGNMTVALNQGVTVIGSGQTAHMTLAGHAGIAAEHATIVHDNKTGTFTLVSDKTVRVNNKPAKNRTLKAGDVIRIEGVSMVFDEPPKDSGGTQFRKINRKKSTN